jgi:hypothetical protein
VRGQRRAAAGKSEKAGDAESGNSSGDPAAERPNFHH